MRIEELIRTCLRAPAGLLWTIGVHELTHLRHYVRGREDPSWMDAVKLWGTGLARIMGVKVEHVNERAGPMGDIIIANHMGFLDVPALLTVYPAVFIIKMEMRRVFYFGRSLALQGHIFVDRSSDTSRHAAREDLHRALEKGQRVIVFPEGRATGGVDRPAFKPFSFFDARLQHKRVELVIIDYLPDRDRLKWDVSRSMIPQLLSYMGRKETRISLEFFPAEIPDDPDVLAQKWHDRVESRLRQHDEQHRQ